MTDTAPGLLLGEIRMRGYRNGAHGALAGRLSDCAAIDVPRLLAAVEAVLAEHAAVINGSYAVCSGCDGSLWPCRTYKAITFALLGDDDD